MPYGEMLQQLNRKRENESLVVKVIDIHKKALDKCTQILAQSRQPK
jgi:hypothetical protein